MLNIAHRGAGMPVVFGVADNDASISLAGHGWLPKFIEQRLGGCKVFVVTARTGPTSSGQQRKRSRSREASNARPSSSSRTCRAAGHRHGPPGRASLNWKSRAAARAILAGFIGDAVERGVLDANTVAARNDEIARARARAPSTRPRPSRSSTTARHSSNASPRRSRPCRRRRPQQPERKTSSGSTRRAF